MRRRYKLLLFVLLCAALWLSGCSDVGEAMKTQTQANLAGAEAEKSEADATLSEARAKEIAVQVAAEVQRDNAAMLQKQTDLYVAAQEARVREAQATAIGIAGFALAVIVVVLLLSRKPATQQQAGYYVPPAARPVRYSLRAGQTLLPEDRALLNAAKAKGMEIVVRDNNGDGVWQQGKQSRGGLYSPAPRLEGSTPHPGE